MLAAAAQAAVLLAVGVYVLVEGVRHLVDPPEVDAGVMLVFGVVGLLGNAVSLALLAGARSGNLNTRAAFLEVLNDALGSVAVLVAAVSIWATGWTRADAVVSLLIGRPDPAAHLAAAARDGRRAHGVDAARRRPRPRSGGTSSPCRR